MIEVRKDDFYKAIGPEDIVPRSERDVTYWEFQHSRQRVGETKPGYVNPCPRGTVRYYLAEDFAARKGVKGSAV
jgi:hypothetical protein